uniref:Uncharacterized protein n=1 Tax=Anguilla anguilla TaxID=7936 RepID=A0A0E9QIE6_ANGAN
MNRMKNNINGKYYMKIKD